MCVRAALGIPAARQRRAPLQPLQWRRLQETAGFLSERTRALSGLSTDNEYLFRQRGAPTCSVLAPTHKVFYSGTAGVTDQLVKEAGMCREPPRSLHLHHPPLSCSTNELLSQPEAGELRNACRRTPPATRQAAPHHRERWTTHFGSWKSFCALTGSVNQSRLLKTGGRTWDVKKGSGANKVTHCQRQDVSQSLTTTHACCSASCLMLNDSIVC